MRRGVDIITSKSSKNASDKDISVLRASKNESTDYLGAVSSMRNGLKLRDHTPQPEPSESEQIIQILIVCLKSVGVVFAMSCAGAYAYWKGIITKDVKKALAEIVMNISMPCLLFTGLLSCPQCGQRGVDNVPGCQPCVSIVERLRESIVLVLLPMVIVPIGLCLGTLLTKTTKVQSDFDRGCIAAVTFGNSTGMPIVLLSVVHQMINASGKKVIRDPLQFMPSFLILYPVLQWSIGSWLFGVGSEPEEPILPPPQNDEEFTKQQTLKQSLRLSHVRSKRMSMRAVFSMADVSDLQETIDEEDLDDVFDGNRSKAVSFEEAVSFESVAIPENDILVNTSETQPSKTYGSKLSISTASGTVAGMTIGNDKKERPSSPRSSRSPKPALVKRVSEVEIPERKPKTMCEQLVEFLQRVIQPPIVAILVGMIIGVTPLRGVLIDTKHQCGDAPMQWVFNAMQRLGQSAVPINVLVLGASMAEGGGLGALPMKVNFGIMICKMVIFPACMLLIVLFLKQHLLLGIGLATRNSIWLVALTVTCTPTANNINVLAQLGKQNTKCLAASIFLQYLCAPVLVTMWLTIFIKSLLTSG